MHNGQRGPGLGLHGSRRRRPGLAARTGLLAVRVVAPLAPAGGSEELTALERHQVALGDLIVKTQEVEGYPWPEVTVYRQVAASPEEVMAVYADFERQGDYLPNLVYSRIVERLASNSFQVSYEYKVAGCRSRNSVAVENRTFWRRTLTPLSARNGGADRPLPAASGRIPPRVAEPVSARARPCRETGGLAKCDNRPPVQVVPLLCNKFKLDVSFPKPLFIFLVLF